MLCHRADPNNAVIAGYITMGGTGEVTDQDMLAPDAPNRPKTSTVK